MSAARRRWGPLLAAPLAACIASNVVAPPDRLVVATPDELAFVPADAAAIPGYYESIDLRGDAAAALRRVFYVFLADGRYAGAALAETADGLGFDTLRGTWTLGAEGLVLDGGAAVVCEMAQEHLRLTAPNGVVVLHREALR